MAARAIACDVPAHVPVTQYSVDDRSTTATRTPSSGMPRGLDVRRSLRACRRTLTALRTSTSDPNAPAADESNWVPTNPHGRFEVLARFYGPQKALFEKTWALADIEKI